MNRFSKNSGPRCACCGVPYQPRMLQNGNFSQTCGKTACVARLSRKNDYTTSRSFNVKAF